METLNGRPIETGVKQSSGDVIFSVERSLATELGIPPFPIIEKQLVG